MTGYEVLEAAGPTDPAGHWRDSAACRGCDTSDFFDPDPEDLGLVLRVCGSCPVRDACLSAALLEEAGQSRHYRFGIRGGLLPGERAATVAA